MYAEGKDTVTGKKNFHQPKQTFLDKYIPNIKFFHRTVNNVYSSVSEAVINEIVSRNSDTDYPD
jgi:hypothetical protein